LPYDASSECGGEIHLQEVKSVMAAIMSARRIRKYLLGFSICGLFLLTVTSLTLARPFRVSKLPDSGKQFRCGTCHVNKNGGGMRNPFGRDYEKIGLEAGDEYTEDLGKLDSDGDGFTNDEEFAAGTNPGDRRSKPGTGGRDK
jgi:hypothetical protein